MASSRRALSIGVLAVFLASPTPPVAPVGIRSAAAMPAAATKAPRPGPPPSPRTLATLPLHFEANHGQTDGGVRFLARAPGYTLFLTPTEAVTAPPRGGERPARDWRPRGLDRTRDARLGVTRLSTAEAVRDARPPGPAVVRMKLLGANPDPLVTGVDQLPGRINYFLGNDPARWRTNIPTYARVRYGDVYPGVDLVYDGSRRRMEFDFVLAPGADPGLIRLAFEGAGSVALDERGDLLLKTAAGELRLQKPHLYQESGGRRVAVDGSFALVAAPCKGRPCPAAPVQVAVQVAAYDTGKPLVIDPVLSYSTYLGGSAGDEGFGIAVDASGNAYVAGQTSSTNFPTASALQPVLGGFSDAFVTKLDPSGATLVYSTYLGGSAVELNGGTAGIAVDASGNAYVTGDTSSTDFPTASALQPASGGSTDAFVTKLNPTGAALVYSTYLGGSSNDRGLGIAVDASGNAHVTGITLSTDFPTASALQPAFGGIIDAFVTKLDPTGATLVYSTYLGGSNNDQGHSIAVDASGNAYVTGFTLSTDFPTVSALQPAFGGLDDAFIARIGAAVPTPPAAPTNLTATVASPTEVALAWIDASTDETGFEIERDSQGGGFALLTFVGPDVQSFQDTTVSVTRTYSYRVRAVGVAGASDFSNIATVTVPAGKLVVLPPRLTFTGVAVGTSATRTVTVRNAGQGTLSGTVGSLAGVFSVLAGSGSFTLTSGQTLTVTVEFTPAQRGTARASLTITSDDPTRPSTRVQVTGIVR
ncbi:MAG: SBBP repeat-containing protein [Candidatus Rokubacteria bacterium]|nr:SBBP repeat-containing protein [Candidatus Rokubacteria bacterium]